MKKIVLLFSFLMMVTFCSCGQQPQQPTNSQAISSNTSQSNSDSFTSTPDYYAALAEPKNGKEAISVLSCDISSEYGFYHFNFTVRNDLEVTINTITVNVSFLDKDGTIIQTTHPQEHARVLPGQSVIIDALCEETLGTAACYVDSISYYDGENNYHSFYLNNPEIFEISVSFDSKEKINDSQSTSKKKTESSTSNPSTNNISTSFTNAYGTPTTKCSHPGCNNYIASSGDTNCCTIHSNRCLNCGKYIDEDASYCMSCIEKSLSSSPGNSNSSTGKSDTSSSSSYSSGKTAKCNYCNGTGKADGGTCPWCNGSGKTYDNIFNDLLG